MKAIACAFESNFSWTAQNLPIHTSITNKPLLDELIRPLPEQGVEPPVSENKHSDSDNMDEGDHSDEKSIDEPPKETKSKTVANIISQSVHKAAKIFSRMLPFLDFVVNVISLAIRW